MKIPKRFLYWGNGNEKRAGRKLGWTLNQNIADEEYAEDDQYLYRTCGISDDAYRLSMVAVGFGWVQDTHDEAMGDVLIQALQGELLAIKALAILCHNAPNRYKDFIPTLELCIQDYLQK